ncbi:hypothetical protein ASC66_16200 [Leifsonia sp. Root4]|uniref:multicopper oxidase family protein n=1 Tax=Leifsonia sp. Root4 TaxID=1736525 RepID=UPI0006F75930|nr:multicopper oxidase family protein [Leifsonia sp. Root4]KQW04007.1 hypothetical protein ASC66_16200 [Leifsonia sp. Root4]
MSTAALLAINLALTIIGAGLWCAATIIAAGPITATRARRALIFAGGAALATLAQLPLVLMLLGQGWWFAQEKLLFALPMQLTAAVVVTLIAAPPLLRQARALSVSSDAAEPGPPSRPAARGAALPAAATTRRLPARVPTALLAATSAAVASVVAGTLIGYPLELAAAAVLTLLAVLATGLGYALFARAGRRLVVGFSALGTLVLVASVALSWMTSMAPPDFAGAQAAHTGGHDSALAAAASPGIDADLAAGTAAAAVSVDDLRTPEDVPGPRRQFTLRAATESVTLASGDTVQSWNYGSLPGPELRVQQGDVVEVRLENVDVAAGVTIHWHGYDVPNGEDGVAGVTQDSVLPGEGFDYRFVADQPGSYWYHTHQSASRGVQRGLYGTLIVEPSGGIAEQHDVVVPLHSIGGSVLLGASDLPTATAIPAGETVRLRLMNTDGLPSTFHLDGTPFAVVAADGHELAAPPEVREQAIRIPAGGRIDLAFTMPDGPVYLTTDASRTAWLAFSPGAAASVGTTERPPDRSDEPELDLLGYGGGPAAVLPDGPLVRAEMVLDRNPRFLQGVPVNGYTVNGAVYPRIPSITVNEGDVVELTVANRGWETHPMHVHGHHVLVLSRNGVAASGAQSWLDTFDVRPGEVWVVAVVADNPGIWMDHCHNLDHAAEGMMMAMRYRGITTPYEHGGSHGNRSE